MNWALWLNLNFARCITKTAISMAKHAFRFSWRERSEREMVNSHVLLFVSLHCSHFNRRLSSQKRFNYVVTCVRLSLCKLRWFPSSPLAEFLLLCHLAVDSFRTMTNISNRVGVMAFNSLIFTPFMRCKFENTEFYDFRLSNIESNADSVTLYNVNQTSFSHLTNVLSCSVA